MSNKIKLIIKIIICSLIIMTLIFLYSRYINTSGFNVKEHTLYNEIIPEKYDGLKMVQISDIHYKVSVDKQKLKDIIKKINLIKPDIVVLTGDLLDKSVNYNEKDISFLIEQLNLIETTIDKYYITGENDYNNEIFTKITNESNFINIDDTYKLIYQDKTPILLAGLSTLKNENKISEKIKNATEYLNNNKNIYSILIMHEPDQIINIDYEKFNLILAGHSHGGQIKIPFINGLLIKNGAKKYINDYYTLNNTKLYISNGLGDSDIKYRFLNKPSFNLFRLRSKKR